MRTSAGVEKQRGKSTQLSFKFARRDSTAWGSPLVSLKQLLLKAGYFLLTPGLF